MALDFPNSPSPGSTFQSGTRSWQYDGNTWVSTSSVGYTGSVGFTGSVGNLITTDNSITSAANITPVYSGFSSQYNVTSLTTNANILTPTSGGGSVSNGAKLLIRLTASGISNYTLNWTTTSGAYRAIGVTLPTAIPANKTIYVGCVYNAASVFWDVIAVSSEL